MCASEARVRLCVEVEKQRAHSGREKLKNSNGLKEMEAIFRVRKTVDQVGRQWVRLECGRQRKVRLDTLHVGLRRTGHISLVLIKSSIYPLIHPCIHPPMHPLIRPSAYPSIHLSPIHPPLQPTVHPYKYPHVHASILPLTHPSPTHLLPIPHPSTLSTSYPYKHPCLHPAHKFLATSTLCTSYPYKHPCLHPPNKYLATCSVPNPK